MGYGIWKVPQENAAASVYNAIKLGYRHIDGAHDYQNSAEAGEGVRKAVEEGICKREELFIVSKLWNNYHAKPHVLEMADFENKNWGVGYLDLVSTHPTLPSHGLEDAKKIAQAADMSVTRRSWSLYDLLTRSLSTSSTSLSRSSTFP